MTYQVKRGDTLSTIAKQFNTTVEALVASNGITNPNLIRTGELLTIPGDRVKAALISCLDAIEDLDEYKTLSGLLEDD